jgi:hypothetical protein
VHREHVGPAFGMVSVIATVISPRSAGSSVSNSSTSTTRSFGTSSTNWPWYVSVCPDVLPAAEGAS